MQLLAIAVERVPVGPLGIMVCSILNCLALIRSAQPRRAEPLVTWMPIWAGGGGGSGGVMLRLPPVR